MKATQFFLLLLLFASTASSQSSCSKALYLDGSEVAALMEPIFLQGDFTLEFWVKIDSTANEDDRLLAGKQYHLFFEQGDLRLADNQDSTILASRNISFANTWRHVAFVRQNGILTLHIDGNNHIQLPSPWNHTIELNILGRSLYKTGFFKGWIDDLRCWDIARSQADIQTWKTRRIIPTNPSYSNLIAYFPLNYSRNSFTRGFSNQGLWLRLPKDDAIQTLYNQAAYIDSCGALPSYIGGSGNSASSQCKVNLPLANMLQDRESPLDLHDIEIVTNPQNGFITDDLPDSVTLNIQFSAPPSRVNVTKAPLRFNKDFALTLTFDDQPISVKNYVQPIVNGGLGANGTNHIPRLSTDGAGNDVAWNMDIAWNCVDVANNDLHLNNPLNLTWRDAIDLYDQGWGINNHSYSHGLFLGTWDFQAEVRKNDNVTFGTFNALGTPIDMNHFIIPSGMIDFVEPAFRSGLKSVHDERGRLGFVGRFGGYWQVDTTTNLNQLGMSRDNWDGMNAHNIMNDINRVAGLSTNGEHYWLNAFTHKITMAPTNHGLTHWDFTTAINTLDTTYGKGGSDRVWVASLQEVYEYMFLRNEVPFSYSWAGSQLRIRLSLNNLPRDFRFYNLSLIVDADAPIASISGTGYDSLTYSRAGVGEKVINLEMSRTGNGLPSQYYKLAGQGVSGDSFDFIVRDRDGNVSQTVTYSIADLCSSGGFLPINEPKTLETQVDDQIESRVFSRPGGIYFHQAAEEAPRASVEVFDILGNLVYRTILKKDKGSHFLFDGAKLSEGVYCYQIVPETLSPNQHTRWSGKFCWKGLQ